MSDGNVVLDDFEQLNQLMTQNYEPQKILALEAPKAEIWDAIKQDNAVRGKEIEEQRQIRRYEIIDKTNAQNEENTNSSYKSYQSNNYNNSYSPYRSYSSGYSYSPKSAEEIVDKEFKDIRDSAYKIAEEELKYKRENKTRSNNPQLEVLMKKKNFTGKIKDSFKPGSWGRKGLLIAGMIAVKGIATVLTDIKYRNKK